MQTWDAHGAAQRVADGLGGVAPDRADPREEQEHPAEGEHQAGQHLAALEGADDELGDQSEHRGGGQGDEQCRPVPHATAGHGLHPALGVGEVPVDDGGDGPHGREREVRDARRLVEHGDPHPEQREHPAGSGADDEQLEEPRHAAGGCVTTRTWWAGSRTR